MIVALYRIQIIFSKLSLIFRLLRQQHSRVRTWSHFAMFWINLKMMEEELCHFRKTTGSTNLLKQTEKHFSYFQLKMFRMSNSAENWWKFHKHITSSFFGMKVIFLNFCILAVYLSIFWRKENVQLRLGTV